ncbi:tripartite tricarboxylate transporter TctB family protein [Deinococcus sp. QL22]|uniref:tripartite tricarboxylate transporter TctB family protein n=1 Tax=Deinococcus sp. QL22 TaxID=2939437 RepID=UPI002017D8EB|nr:tripartite tricarboxylate transporter TctB family protein [Deinococcus sp. QL22]UQN10258.1 tripartite tricarboxylate transporter TctB family protein [Deinococcus sp. QL22]
MEQEHPGWELGLSIFLILIGIAVWVLTAAFPPLDDGAPGPALFPRVIGGGLVVGGGLLAWSAIKDLRGRIPTLPFLASRAGLLKVFATIAIGAAVPFLLPYITLVGGAAVAACLFTLLIGGDVPRSLGVGVVTALIVYGVFGKLLGVPLT